MEIDARGKVLPHNTEAELFLLGSLLLDNDNIDSVASVVSPEDFYKPANGLIFRHILQLRDRGEPVDLVTLTESLTKSGELEKVGGVTYLSQIADTAPLASNAEEYARIIKEKATLRNLIVEASKIIEEAYQPSSTLEDFFSSVEKRIFEILESGQPQNIVNMKEAVSETVSVLEQMLFNPYYQPGIPSGYSKLDNYIYGFQPGNFVILAARPSKGKTSFALNVALQVALQHFPVLFISMEMPVRDLVNRLIANIAEIPLDRLIRGLISKDTDLPRVYNAMETLSKLDIRFDTTSRTLYEVRAKIRKFVNDIRKHYKDRNKLGLVIIDYLQLMSFGGRAERRELEIAEISRGLKNLALELHIPIMALSQLNRDVEKREKSEPRLSDLRESGALEQDADLIMFIYDPNEGKRKKGEELPDMGENEYQQLNIKIAKQRNGMQGIVEFYFYRKYTLFRDSI